MKKKLSFFDKMMMALTFAEANEQDTAREIISTGWVDASGQQEGCRTEKSSQHSTACRVK